MRFSSDYEQRRVAKVMQYKLSFEAQNQLDRLTRLASLSCNTPIAVITLIDSEKQRCFSTIGTDIKDTTIDDSFCVYALHNGEFFEVQDTLKDERFKSNSLVTGQPGIRFYAGFPLAEPDGYLLGTICVLDKIPRALTNSEKEALKLLAEEVMFQVNAIKKQEDLVHFERLFNLSNDLLCLSGQNNYFKKVNPAFENILGWTEQEALSKPIPYFVHPDDRARSQREADKFREGETSVKLVNRIADKKGEYRLFEWLTSFDTGSATMYGIGRDISRQNQIEKTLLNTKELLEDVSRIGVIGGWEYNLQEDRLTWSPVVREILELPADYEPTYKDFLKFYREGENRDKATLLVRDAIENCVPFDVMLQVITSGGKPKWVRKMARVQSENNKCIRIYGILQDVHLFKTREDEIVLSERRFRNMFDYSPIGKFLADARTLRFTEANKAFLSMSGYSAEELSNTPLTNIVHDFDLSVFVEELNALRAGKSESLKVTFKLVTKQLHTVSVELVASFLKSENGVPLMLIGHTQDITARMNAERRLKLSEEKHRAFFQYTTGLMFTHDLNGALMSMNPAAWTLLGFKEEPRAYTLYDITAPAYKELLPAYFENIKKKGEAEGLMHVIDRNGKERAWMFKDVVAESLNGDAYVISNAIDITERVAMEEQLKKANDEARITTRAKDLFLANISHEIRTPINAITGFTNLLAQTSLSGQQKNFVSFISTAGENLTGIVNDILDFAKVQAGSVQIDATPFEPRDVINHVCTALQPKINEKGLLLELNIAPDVPKQLLGDALRLNQILLNLLNNAVKFTSSGFVRVSAEVQQETGNTCTVLFKVADSGIGIAPENRDLIFQQFVQADADTNRQYGGTGLGLSICRSLVSMHNGRIWVESERGKGSVFSFTIPYKTVEKVVEKQQAIAPEVLKSDIPLQILLVEDNLLNQLLAMTVLENFGFVPHLAENGKQAVEKLRAENYDLVIMDLQMPEMDGYEATIYIRNVLHLSIPIIAMTANSLPGEKERCVALGMNDYIPKPFQQEELFMKIMHYSGNSLPGTFTS